MDDDWKEVVGEIQKSRKIWALLSIIMVRDGASTRVSGIFSKTVVHAVLIFGSDTWVTTTCIGRALGEFQNSVAQSITVMHPQQLLDGIWYYPPLETEIQGVRFE